MIVKACKAINKAYTKLKSIDSDIDLKKNDLTLSDYKESIYIFHELTKPGNTAETYFSNVAAFFEKCDFLVVAEKGHYIIWTEV